MGPRHWVWKPVLIPLEGRGLEGHGHDIVSLYVLSPLQLCTFLEVKGSNWTNEWMDRQMDR